MKRNKKESKDDIFRVYKELILEVVDTHLLSCYDPWREKYKSIKYKTKKDGTQTFLERIKPIDEDFEEVINNLTRIGGPLYRYDSYGNLVKSYIDVLKWRDLIEATKGLTDALDVKYAILREMKYQENEFIESGELNQLVAEEGKGAETTPSIATKVRLKLVSETRDVYWEGKKYGDLPKTPFRILYTVTMRPGQTLPYDLLKMFLGEALQEKKAISKHKATIIARIPPLEPYIKTDVGLHLELSIEETQVVGNIDYVDSQIATYEARQLKDDNKKTQKKYKK